MRPLSRRTLLTGTAALAAHGALPAWAELGMDTGMPVPDQQAPNGMQDLLFTEIPEITITDIGIATVVTLGPTETHAIINAVVQSVTTLGVQQAVGRFGRLFTGPLTEVGHALRNNAYSGKDVVIQLRSYPFQTVAAPTMVIPAMRILGTALGVGLVTFGAGPWLVTSLVIATFVAPAVAGRFMDAFGLVPDVNPETGQPTPAVAFSGVQPSPFMDNHPQAASWADFGFTPALTVSQTVDIAPAPEVPSGASFGQEGVIGETNADAW